MDYSKRRACCKNILVSCQPLTVETPSLERVPVELELGVYLGWLSLVAFVTTHLVVNGGS